MCRQQFARSSCCPGSRSYSRCHLVTKHTVLWHVIAVCTLHYAYYVYCRPPYTRADVTSIFDRTMFVHATYMQLACVQDSSPDATPYQVPASPFGVPHQMPRAHSAFVSTRAHIFNDSSLLTAESAPQGLLPLALGVGLEGADQAEASPKKAGRLQHLKMRVAVC